jgi:hypothetical protein
MKKLTGILAGAALLLAGTNLHAQTGMSTTTSSGKTVSLQARAGVNFQNLNGKIAGNNADGDLMTAFHAGIDIPIMIAPEFYFQPGVLYSMKGAKSKNNSDNKTQISYIEVPVNFVYKPMLGMGNLILGVGPYVAFGIGGKVKSSGGDEDIKFDNDITLVQAAADTYVRRMDYGGNLLAGYQLSNGFLLQLNAQLGMSNIFPKINGSSSDDYKLKNTGFGVSLGYGF